MNGLRPEQYNKRKKVFSRISGATEQSDRLMMMKEKYRRKYRNGENSDEK